MREQTITIYKFDELSDEAKESAIEAYREIESSTGHAWGDDYVATLAAFRDALDLFDIDSWEYGGGRGNDHVTISWHDSAIMELEGVRLWKYLNNNYPQLASTDGYSLTGFCADGDILGPLTYFMKHPNQHTTFEDLVQDCTDAWVTSATADYEYQFSDEAITETIEANEYEFYDDGTLV